jgi:radical SAM superfamily enzyme YgiQ (UPF0313 family)
MKIDIIIAYVQRYKYGHEKDFVPPITGIHLASLTPERHEVRIYHEQIDCINFESDADLIAISFFSGFAQEAFRLAQEFKKRNKIVIAGGPHVTFNVEESIQYFDSIVTGEAESVWLNLLADAENGNLQKVYTGKPIDLAVIPRPKYELLSNKFFIKKVIQATRGCPYSCSFCSVPVVNPGFRKRPVKDVIRDISYDRFDRWWQRKVVWFWDDNLTIDRKYIKELLKEMKPLKKWWLTQASVDIVKDDELLKLMKDSGCIGVFLGLETFGESSIADADKKQNKISEYKYAVNQLHKYGIAVMTGLIAGFDHDTYDSIVDMSVNLMKIGIEVPFLSIMTPFAGTKIYSKLKKENRLLRERNWDFYNGYNVTYEPKNMSPDTLLKAHRELWAKSFSFKNSLIRIIRSFFYLRFGAFCLTVFMNGFYGFKKLRQNLPIDMAEKNNKKFL